MTAGAWSADTTKAGFLGMTAHWIEMKEQKWKMRAEVIMFKALLGTHSIGRYIMGLLDHVGIMDKKSSKAWLFTLYHSILNLIIDSFSSSWQH